MTIDNKEPLVLQVGHTYVRADGTKHTANKDDGRSFAPIRCGIYWYERNGESAMEDRSKDLIAEYKEPTTQDEWGPWQDYGSFPEEQGKYYDYAFKANSTTAVALRVKKEPKAFTDSVWINEQGIIFSADYDGGDRKAIITTRGDNISIRWADEVDAKD